MAGLKRTSILTSWAMPGFKTSNVFASVREECRLPRANKEMWERVLHTMVGDRLLLMGAPGSKK